MTKKFLLRHSTCIIRTFDLNSNEKQPVLKWKGSNVGENAQFERYFQKAASESFMWNS